MRRSAIWRRRERIERGYLGKVLELTLLAPDVVEAIVDGRQRAEASLPETLNGVATLWRHGR